MVGTAIAIAAAIAAAALAVRSASTARTAPAGAALDKAVPSPSTHSPAHAPQTTTGTPGEEPSPRPDDAPTLTAPGRGFDQPAMPLLTAGSATSGALPVLYAPSRPAPPPTTSQPAVAAPRNGSSAHAVAGPLGIFDDRPLDDVLASAFEIAPARARPTVRLAVGIAALSVLFAVGSIVAVRSVTLLVDKMLH